MKTNTNYKNYSFNGYKNLYAHTIDLKKGNSFSFVGMELNNEDGNDLERWEAIQRKLNPRKEPSNVISFHNFLYQGKNSFSISEHKLNIDSIDAPELEKTKVKAFTLMADLTKKIINSRYHGRTNKEHITFTEIVKQMKQLFRDETTCKLLTMEAALRLQEPKKVAEFMNRNIAYSMKEYFRRF